MPLIKLNNRSIKDVTSLPFGVGNMILISSQTASNSASISFTTGINSTYKEYQFYFIDIHPRTDIVNFTFQLSTNSGSTYATTITSTTFNAIQDEAGTTTELAYNGYGLAQSTSFQSLTRDVGSDADQNLGGSMSLFNPSSTTYVKHFIANVNLANRADYTVNMYTAGYGNTTSAINAIRFQMSSGNFDGTIAMFGVV
ncbi:hypothetical protein EBU71_14930 [bacterium]|nr:hypothetical protein [Candidatus Elulimicrobium humile]